MGYGTLVYALGTKVYSLKAMLWSVNIISDHMNLKRKKLSEGIFYILQDDTRTLWVTTVVVISGDIDASI